jgi:chemotaxis protein CheD
MTSIPGRDIRLAIERQVVVGISDAKVSGEPGSVLVTFALGSCVAVCMYDAVNHVGGLLHILLPDSALDPQKAQANPFTFADTGVPLLVKQMVACGASERRLSVRLAGGAQISAGPDLFGIGKQNHAAVRKMLCTAGLMVDGEQVGGDVSRTVRLDVNTGRFLVWEGAGIEREIPLKARL